MSQIFNNLQRLEIDQSVRIEELNRNTVIGITNGINGVSYIIPRKAKRHFNEQFRREGKPRQCAPTIFAVAIVTSLQLLKIQPSQLVIDDEYSGHERIIMALINSFYPDSIITIERIGRHSLAHAAAYNTHLGHIRPKAIISLKHLNKVLTNKKTAGELHRPGLTRVHKPNQPVNKNLSKRL